MPRLSLLLLSGLLAVPMSSGRAMEPPGPLDAVLERLLFWQDRSAPQAPAPRPLPPGPAVRLDDLSDAVSLERALRRGAGGSSPALTVPDGTARLGGFAVGTTDSIAGHLLVVGGNAEIFGQVGGNVVVLDGDIVVHPGGRLAGDALALGGSVRDLAGGVSGESRSVSRPEPAEVSQAPSGLMVRGAGILGVFATLLIVGFGLVTFARPPLEVVSDTVHNSLGRAFVVGLLAEILVLPTFGMLVVGLALTIVGVVLIPFTVAAYVLLLLAAVVMGLIAVAHAMGETQARRRMARGERMALNSYRYLLTGLLSIFAVWAGWFLFSWVPVAGGLILAVAIIVTWLVATVGFGASILSRVGVRTEFAGRIVPQEALTDEYLWATPQFGVPAVKRPDKKDGEGGERK